MSPSPGQIDLSGRKAIVTGGSRGLGRATVRGLAEAGTDVVVVDKRAKEALAVAEEVAEETGRELIAHACHMGHWDEIDGLVDAAYEAFGRVDILVNNAGMSPKYGTPSSITEEQWDKVLAVNLKGPFRLTALVGERMAQDGGGSIINVSSISALHPNAAVIPYAAAKAGLNSITLAFARTFGPTVRVNSIVPGTFLTDISSAWNMDQFHAESENFALKRGAEPEEIVGTMLYLASGASSYTTGALLNVDGGYLLAGRFGQAGGYPSAPG